MRRRRDLLGEIEDGALDPSSDLPTLLRRCITLGGETGSERLRDWASKELKGYEPDDELPTYRTVTAPLLLDGGTYGARIKGQMVPLPLIPDFAREKVGDQVLFPQPIGEIAHLLSSARARHDDIIRLAPPGSDALVALMNDRLARGERDRYLDLPPSQVIERIYWGVSLSPVARILDVVRTTLVELVAEMRAGTPRRDGMPTREVAERAVEVAIKGNRNRVVINQLHATDHAVVAGRDVSSTDRESLLRTVFWWAVAIATIVSAVAAVWVLVVK